jgi:hypothetical protein
MYVYVYVCMYVCIIFNNILQFGIVLSNEASMLEIFFFLDFFTIYFFIIFNNFKNNNYLVTSQDRYY